MVLRISDRISNELDSAKIVFQLAVLEKIL